MNLGNEELNILKGKIQKLFPSSVKIDRVEYDTILNEITLKLDIRRK